jgi:hypothetical protein
MLPFAVQVYVFVVPSSEKDGEPSVADALANVAG